MPPIQPELKLKIWSRASSAHVVILHAVNGEELFRMSECIGPRLRGDVLQENCAEWRKEARVGRQGRIQRRNVQGTRKTREDDHLELKPIRMSQKE